jgi:hypothetical protein
MSATKNIFKNLFCRYEQNRILAYEQNRKHGNT